MLVFDVKGDVDAYSDGKMVGDGLSVLVSTDVDLGGNLFAVVMDPMVPPAVVYSFVGRVLSFSLEDEVDVPVGYGFRVEV